MIPTAEEMFEANPILPIGVERQACISFMKVYAKLHLEAQLSAIWQEFENGMDSDMEEVMRECYPLENLK